MPKKHQRVNDILLGPLERPALQWLSTHMPAWMSPDKLTLIGIIGAMLTFTGYLLSRQAAGWLWLASLGFVINWFGDSLDGTLARHRHIERPVYGFYVDHVVDSACQVLFFAGLGLSPYVSFNVAMVALAGYQVMGLLVYTLTYVVGEYRISYSKLGPTEIRVIAILMNTCMYFFGMVYINFNRSWFGVTKVEIYDLLVGTVAFLLFGFFLNSAWQKGRELRAIGK